MADIKVRVELSKNNFKDFDKYNGLKDVESLSQSSPDAGSIYYDSLESSGAVKVVDKNGEIYKMLSEGEIDNSNTNISVIANGNIIRKHLGNNSSYDKSEKILNIELGDEINSLDILQYPGYIYPEKEESLATILFTVLNSLRPLLFGINDEFTLDEFKGMLSDKHDENLTLYEFLESSIVNYPFIEQNETYRSVIAKFCAIAQMQMFIDENNNIKFVSARPRIFDNINNAIYIEKKNMFSKLDYDIILKNKYDGLEVNGFTPEKKQEFGVTVFSQQVPVSSNLEDYEISSAKNYAKNYYNYAGSGTISLAVILCDYYLKSGSVYVNKKSNYNLTQMQTHETLSSENSYTYDLTYKRRTASADGVFDVNIYSDDSVASTYQLKELTNGTFTDVKGGLLGQIQGDSFTYTATNPHGDIVATAKVQKPFLRESMVVRDEDENGFWLDYKVVVGRKIYKLGKKIFANSTTNHDATETLSGEVIEDYPERLDVYLKGDQYTIYFEDSHFQTSNFNESKTPFSLNLDKLVQKSEMVEEITSNILMDYMKGISSGNVSISCSDYYNKLGKKVIDWNRGETVELNDVVCFENDKYLNGNQRYWKVKGKNFTYSGVPMINLELQEINNLKLEDYTWQQIKQISDLGKAEKMFSVGDEKRIILSNGETIIVQIAGFNNRELENSETKKSSITFVTKNAISGQYPLTGTNGTGTSGWENCLIRTQTLPDVFNSLPNDLKDTISSVKNTINNIGWVEEVYDPLWLLDKNFVRVNVLQFPLFNDSSNLKKGYSWWLRPEMYDISEAYIVNEAGEIKWNYKTKDEYKLIFGFCI